MADGAVLREACSRMIGIGSGLECWTVATDALSACSGKRVTRVALQTRDANVRSREWETCPTMIKLCPSPLGGRMTNRAILRETRRCMVRIGGVLKRRTMTGNTRRTRSGENATHVALGTIDVDVGSSQREASLIVFKLGATPLLRGVAGLAIGREPGRHMVWIGRASERTLVAAHAVSWRAGESSSHMTLGAGDRGMGSRQGEARRAVVKLGSRPC